MRALCYILSIVIILLCQRPVFAEEVKLYASIIEATPPNKIVTEIKKEHDKTSGEDFYRRYQVYL